MLPFLFPSPNLSDVLLTETLRSCPHVTGRMAVRLTCPKLMSALSSPLELLSSGAYSVFRTHHVERETCVLSPGNFAPSGHALYVTSMLGMPCLRLWGHSLPVLLWFLLSAWLLPSTDFQSCLFFPFSLLGSGQVVLISCTWHHWVPVLGLLRFFRNRGCLSTQRTTLKAAIWNDTCGAWPLSAPHCILLL